MTKTVLSVIFLIVSVLTFVYYVGPTYDNVQNSQDTVAQYDEALSKTREIQELKSSLLSRYNLFTQSDVERLQKMLPDHVDNVRLVLDMDGIASKYGIRIQSVSVEEPRQEAEDGAVLNGGDTQNLPYKSLTLQFEVISTYDEFVLLLKDLESSLRVVDLVSLNISPLSAEIQDNYTFNVSLMTYWLP
ncbi:hypothetical protein COB52_01925 [Candidatus Kaiserbacteria bacterium]|nr:MAG: hypothetical protein COB52_01925 [Candidatus Kaiserbacteria bacterium]